MKNIYTQFLNLATRHLNDIFIKPDKIGDNRRNHSSNSKHGHVKKQVDHATHVPIKPMRSVRRGVAQKKLNGETI